MKAHPHTRKIVDYWKDCMTTETPWKLWEIKRDSHWYQCTATDMYFGRNREYRRVANG